MNCQTKPFVCPSVLFSLPYQFFLTSYCVHDRVTCVSDELDIEEGKCCIFGSQGFSYEKCCSAWLFSLMIEGKTNTRIITFHSLFVSVCPMRGFQSRCSPSYLVSFLVFSSAFLLSFSFAVTHPLTFCILTDHSFIM